MPHPLCPICSASSSFIDAVDFNKSCEEFNDVFLEKSGQLIEYYQCCDCHFVFAHEMYLWTNAQLKEKIYNEEYFEIDPEHIEIRPKANAQYIDAIAGEYLKDIKHLDYGGGNGLLSRLLKDKGCNSQNYDPFYDHLQSLNQKDRFELITAFEVFEHVPNITEIINRLRDLLSENGIILFSTLLSDGEISKDKGLAWWYAAPRNGHISLFSKKSLLKLGSLLGLKLFSLSHNFHFFAKNVPDWIKPLYPSEVTRDSIKWNDSEKIVNFKNLRSFPDWVDWLQGNLERQCNPSELKDILLQNQFSENSIQELLTPLQNIPSLSAENTKSQPTFIVNHQEISNPKLTQPDSGSCALKILTNKLQIYLIEDFLSEAECQEIIEMGQKQLRPSKLTLDDIESSYRTSQTCDLGLMNNPFIGVIDKKIYDALGIPQEFSEVTQLQKYEIGQEFKQHTDYFKPNTKEFEMNGLTNGNRTWTFMIYLNNVPRGGGTHFYAINKTIIPRRGMAVVWNSLYPNGEVNPDTLHSGLPIEEGQKYVITKWFRERPSNLPTPPQELTASYFACGNELLTAKDLLGAIDQFTLAVAQTPTHAPSYYNRGNALLELGKYEAALLSYEQAIQYDPNSDNAYFNRGIAYMALKHHEKAITSFDEVIKINPNYVGAFNNRGLCYQQLNKLQPAIASFQEVIKINPGLVDAHLNLSLCALLSGNFDLGWKEFEWRWADGGHCSPENRKFPQTMLWLGDRPLENKTILLYCEQGFGDALQFCRYVPLVAALGAKLIIETPSALKDLFMQFSNIAQVIKQGDPLPNFDFHCPLLSLPLAFKTRLENIPTPKQYLYADEAKIAHWEKKLGKKERFRVGIIWSGNQGHQNDLNRSIAFSNFANLIIEKVDFICLQTEIRENDKLSLEPHPTVQFFGPDIHDFSDTAALCSLLDLVITVDTSVAHLAGSLGKPTWLLVPYSPDWRWLLDRTDSPWYQSIKIYRQTAPGDWMEILSQVKQDLISRAHNG